MGTIHSILSIVTVELHINVFLICTGYITIVCLEQVAIDVEREGDEGGTVGETFIDYVRFYF